VIEHVAAVLKAGGIRPNNKYVLLVYANYADTYGYCWPSEKRMVADTGLSRASIQRAKAALVEQKLIKQERRRNRKTGEPISNLVRLNLELIASLERPAEKWDDDLVDRITFGDDEPECDDLGMTQSEAQGMTHSEAMTQPESYLSLNLSHAKPHTEALSVREAVSEPSLSLVAAAPTEEEREEQRTAPRQLTAREAAQEAVRRLRGISGGPTRAQIENGVESAIQRGLPPSRAVDWLNSLITPHVRSAHRVHLANVGDLPDPEPDDAYRWAIEMCTGCDHMGVTTNPDYTSGKNNSVVCLHGREPEPEAPSDRQCSSCGRKLLPRSMDPCGRCRRMEG